MTILRTLFTGALAASAICSTAWAKGDDVDFARALVQNGYVDLAQEYCKRIESDPATSPEDKAGVQLIQAEIFAKTASLQEDTAKAAEELDKAVKVLEDFIRANGSHPRAPEAKFTIGVLLRQKGDVIVATLKKTADSSKKAELIAEGDKNFKAAESYFEGLQKEYRSMKESWWQKTNGRQPNEEEKREEEEIRYNLMDSIYNVPRTLYSHCLLYEPGSKEKSELANKAVGGFMDFELDYQDQLKAYESSIFWALTHKELGEFDKVYQRFDFTISLKDFFQGAQMPDDAREVILTAYYYKATTYNEQRKYRDAEKTIDEMLKLIKDVGKDRIGVSAVLVKGDALLGSGDKDAAIKLGTDLMKQVSSPGLQALIRKKVAEWSSGAGGGVGLYLIKYEAALDEDNYIAAIAALQGGIAAAEAADAHEAIADLLWKMGGIYERLDRPYDAVICYETIATDYQKWAKAAEAAFRAAQVWNTIAAAIGEERSWEKDQVAKNLTTLTSKWPNDPNSKNAQYLVADALYQKGKYDDAAKEFAKVPEDAKLYEQAIVMAGRCYYDQAKKLWAAGTKDKTVTDMFDKAETSFRKYLDYVKKGPSKIEEIQKNRPGVEAFCKQALANVLMHDARKKFPEAIKVLDEIDNPPEVDGKRADVPDDVKKRVWRQKVTAYLAMDDTAKAVEVTEKMMEKYRASAVTVEACQLVGAKCDEEAEKLAGENPTPESITPEAMKLWELAAKYYANWIHSGIEAKQKIKVDDALAVADRIYNLGLLINKIDTAKSFTSVELDKLKNPRIFVDAARIYEPVANEQLGRLQGVDTSKLLLKLAWCHDFAQNWEGSRDAYEILIDSERLRKKGSQTLEDAVLKAKPWLFVAYEELGHVYIRLAAKGENKANYMQEAYTIFANVVSKSEKDTEAWWRAKYLVIKILFEKGGQNDFEMALMGVKDMRANYPNWDEDKFKMRDRWIEMEKAILDRAPKK
ncbi:MAG: tetratricopeptide repeat protein [Planctomycetia bacterium]|nr:tetratricopeptide repeat protein [Planctomycetia bacterium]